MIIREGKRTRQTKHKLNKYLLALTYIKGGPIIACLTITEIIGVVQRNFVVNLRCLAKVRWPTQKSQCIWLFSIVFDNKNQYLAFKRLSAAKLVVSASDSQSGGPGFESRIGHLLELFSVVPLKL